MDKLKGFIINVLSAGMIGFAVALFEFIFLDPTKDLLSSSIIYFVFSAVIATIASSCYSWTRYKGYSTLIAYLASMFGNGLSVLILLIVILQTHKAYGWDAVLSIVLITQVLALAISYFENRYYKTINKSLEEKKKNFKKERS